MIPRRSGSPSVASTAGSGPARSRIGASRLRPVDGMCRTTHTAASIPTGSPAITWRNASTPPAEAAIPITRRGKLAPMSTPHQNVRLIPSLHAERLREWPTERPDTVSAVPQPKRVEVKVGDVSLSLSNLAKPMYPRAGFTKGHVIDYYTRIAPVLLEHLRARPLTLKRYPNGVEDKFFYEKRCPAHRPEWVRTTAVWSGRNEGDIDFC